MKLTSIESRTSWVVRFSLFLSIISTYLALFATGWWPLKQQGLGGGHKYVDLSAVIHSAKCYREIGSSVYKTSADCLYQYGRTLLNVLNIFHITQSNSAVIGFIFFGLVVLFLGFIAFSLKFTIRQSILIFFLLVSTGPWLLLERGNFDSLILIMLMFSIPFLNTRFGFIGIVLVGLTALFKFYTLPIFLLMFLIEKGKLNRFLIAGVVLAITPIIFLDISATKAFPNPTFAAFGLPAPGLWFNFFAWKLNLSIILTPSESYAVGFFMMILFVYLAIFTKLGLLLRIPDFQISKVEAWKRNVFLVATTSYLSCYLAGMNYDYRLIYLIISLVFLNSFVPHLMKSYLFFAIEFGALWFTYYFIGATGPVPVLLAVFGNVCQFVLAVMLIVIVARKFNPVKGFRATLRTEYPRDASRLGLPL